MRKKKIWPLILTAALVINSGSFVYGAEADRILLSEEEQLEETLMEEDKADIQTDLEEALSEPEEEFSEETAGEVLLYAEDTEAEQEIFQNTVTEVTVNTDDNNEVLVEWKTVDNAKSYRIYRKEEGGRFAGIITVDADTRNYVDKTAQPGKTYYYTVKGFWEENAKGTATQYPGDIKITVPEEETSILAEGTCGENLIWKLDSSGTLYISGNGDMEERKGWEKYDSLIKKIIIEEGVTSVANYAFGTMKNLETVVLADSVTYIGWEAFYSCSNLKSIEFSENLIEIGSVSFSGCVNLEEIELPQSLVKIGGSAFGNCDKLINVVIPDSVTILEGAFDNCKNLRNITLPDSIECLSNGMFANCIKLRSVSIPDDVKEIEKDAFSGCISLDTIDLPENLEVIGDYAFSGCTSLNTIDFPENLEAIGDYAFSGCSLESFALPGSVSEIGDYAFSLCTGLTEITIPNTVTEVGRGLFSGCSALQKAELSDRCAGISDNMFRDCVSLKEVIIPDSVMEIGYSAFDGCTGLEEITIPNSVSEIKYSAFENCGSLLEIAVKGDAPKAYYDSFAGCPSDMVIYVPEKAQGYEEKPWNSYRIVYGTDTGALEKILQKAKGYEEEEYSHVKATYQALEKVIKETENLLDKTDVSQKEINLQAEKLEEAISKLTEADERVKCEFQNTLLQINLLENEGKVTIQWEQAENARSYRIYRKEQGGSFTGLASVDENTTTYVDTTAEAGKTYCYSVKGFWEKDARGIATDYPSNLTIKLPIDSLETPQISTKSVNYCTVDISWKKIDDAEKYVIYRKEAKAGTSFKSLETVSGSSLKYRDGTAKMGVSYYYTVKAYAGNTASDYVKNVKGMAVPSAPKLSEISHFASSSTHKGGVRIKWTGSKAGSNQFVDGYRIFRKTAGGSWKAIGTVGKNVRSFDDSTGKSGTTYYYTVRPYVKLSNGTNLWGSYDTAGKSVRR